MLEILTFTGVDSRTSMLDMHAIAQKYPKIEFGVLVGSLSGHSNIFPSLNIVREFRDFGVMSSDDYKNDLHTAIHLCGVYSLEVMQAEGASEGVFEMCRGFGRVQINLHGDEFNSNDIDTNAAAIRRFADKVSCDSVILQHKSGWEDVPVVDHPKVEYLYDRSGGAGRAAFHEWPDPPLEGRYGFAGGIGPDTIGEAMTFVHRWPEYRLWMDMEGRVRKNRWFDLKAVERVCEIAFA